MLDPDNPRFLVVDDFSTMRRIIKGLLKDLGYQRAEEAEDGDSALKLIRTQTVDIVITDINMPNINGFELLSIIKTDPDLRHLPVLMVTAEARKEDIVRAAKGGAAGYIIKPFNKVNLEEKIRAIVARTAR